jgi:lipoprotein-anchoring transpeptidase ErfK/SrfK
VKKYRAYIGSLVVVALSVGLGYWTTPRSNLCANPGSCAALPTLSVENGAKGVFSGQEVTAPPVDLAEVRLTTNVLGEDTAEGEKHIYVDLENQLLSAYQGETLYMQAPVSTGKWGRTPAGDYTIWVKMRATRMAGGQGSDYYNLPNVPYVMFFYSEKVPQMAGYSFHGAYWHNNFGHPMSHGCVNMRQIDAEKLYNWASPTTSGNITHADADNKGTKVTIY